MYRDWRGLIVQRDGDGGDTCQRTGMYYFGLIAAGLDLAGFLNVRAELQDQLEVLEVSGYLYRHPFQQRHNDISNVSRDQTDPMIVALGAYRLMAQLDRVHQRFKDRWYFYQNKDVPQIQTLSLWVRAYRVWWLWPVLNISDLGLLFGAFATWFQAKRNPDHSDDNNQIIRLIQAVMYLPTPVSWLARWVYKSIRPYTPSPEDNAVMGALCWYHRAENGGNPEIAEVYRPLIEKYF